MQNIYTYAMGTRSPIPISPQARRLGMPRPQAWAHCSRRPCGLTIFSVDFLHHLDLKVALSQQLLELGILRRQGLESLHIDRLQLPEILPPGVDRLFADLVFLAAAATEVRSASRRIATICSSLNRLFLIGFSLASKSHLSRNQWSEKVGQVSGCYYGGEGFGGEAQVLTGDGNVSYGRGIIGLSRAAGAGYMQCTTQYYCLGR
jgi:hypothetical protein